MKIKISLVCLCVLMCLMVSSRAQSTLIRPDASVAGRSQAEWSVAWWQWVLSFPESRNPNVDTTGAFPFSVTKARCFFSRPPSTPRPSHASRRPLRSVLILSFDQRCQLGANFRTWWE